MQPSDREHRVIETLHRNAVFCDTRIGWNRLGIALSAVILAIAGAVLYRLLRTIDVGEVLDALETGIREIAGEVRNSLDFHRSQEGGGEVSHIVLSGCAQDIPGFTEALQSALGVEVRTRNMAVANSLGGVSPHRLAVAAGLAVQEAPQ